MKTNEYTQSAESFLEAHAIKFRATLSNSKVAPWSGSDKVGDDRNHYRVTLSKGGRGALFSKRLTFDFWGSINDWREGKAPTSYDVLACISSDVNIPESFKDYCAEFGESIDSIKALQTYRRCSAFARRLRAFFTEAEILALAEIN